MSATSQESGFGVVAVDGSAEGDAAVRFAAELARQQQVSLRLAHVMPAYLPIGPLLMVAGDEGAGAFASETLASATRLVEDLSPGVPVTAMTLMGGRVSQIIEATEGASFVVVGRRASSALDRAWSGGTLDGVASRAHVPVYVVPSVVSEAASGRVVAGLKGPEHAAELFDSAFAAADELRAELEIVHAWKLSTVYDDIIARRVSEATWNRDQKAAIRALVSPWQEGYPHTQVKIKVVHDYPVRALVEASRAADRLVLVKPLHGGALHHLGRTARGALRFSRCPVEIVPARRADDITLPPVVLEREGELVR